MIEYILSYVTKIQKGMSVIMEWASREARDGDMELKESVRHRQCISQCSRNISTRGSMLSVANANYENES